MRRLIITVFLWVVAMVLWTPIVMSKSPNPYQELYDEVLAPVVKIVTPQGRGSGVVVSSENRVAGSEGNNPQSSLLTTGYWILTAAHVVGNQSTVTVYIYEYASLPDKSGNYSSCLIYEADVVITDTAKDLALLHTPNPSQEGNNSPLKRGGWGCVAKLAPRDYKPYLFTPVYAVGCSLGLDPRPSEGIISAIDSSTNAQNDEFSYWEVTAPVLPGNSGGGIFDKETRHLIGIVVWVRTYHGQLVTTMVGIVPINEIYEFLHNAPVSNYIPGSVRTRTGPEWLIGHTLMLPKKGQAQRPLGVPTPLGVGVPKCSPLGTQHSEGGELSWQQ